MRALLLSALTLAALLAPAAGAADVSVPPLVGACVETRYTPCPAIVCVGFSRQVPQCVDGCRVGQAECVGSLACADLNGRGACVPDPCYTTACTVAAGGPQCMPRYQEVEVGPVRYVSRDSCHHQVYVFGEPILS